MNIISSLSFLVILFNNLCNAHISMSNPPSRRNAGSSYYTSSGLVNYNLRSPLNVDPDYFTFPCKGFPVGPSVSTFNNNKISVTLEGTATHGGGHCQFGISYDNKNFLVLKTVLNSCLLDSMSYDFDLPENAPGGQMTIFWSWVNRVGNREYYMECADITVNNGNSPNQISSLRGTELLVVNLPGYPSIPEWNPGDSPEQDGRSLFYSRKEITLNVNGNQDNTQLKIPIIPIVRTETKIPETEKQEIEKKIETPKKQKPIKYKSKKLQKNISDMYKKEKCELGKMKCNNNGFDTCVHDEWVYRDCAPGTVCKPFGTSIICDFPQS